MRIINSSCYFRRDITRFAKSRFAAWYQDFIFIAHSFRAEIRHAAEIKFANNELIWPRD